MELKTCVLQLITISYMFIDTYASFDYNSKDIKHGPDTVWCRSCGVPLMQSNSFSNRLSPGILKVEFRRILGKNITVQFLADGSDSGIVYEVVTSSKASCHNVGQNFGTYSLYPGYSWRICTCPFCGVQLGWTFEKAISNSVQDVEDFYQTFHVLMLGRLLDENSTASADVITVPSDKKGPEKNAKTNTLYTADNKGDVIVAVKSNTKSTTETDLDYKDKNIETVPETDKGAIGKVVVLVNRSHNVTTSEKEKHTEEVH